jgi:hypothetical protein
MLSVQETHPQAKFGAQQHVYEETVCGLANAADVEIFFRFCQHLNTGSEHPMHDC